MKLILKLISFLPAHMGNSNKLVGLFKHFISTGRVAMHDPNLLGIDNDQTIKIDDETYNLSLKCLFVAKAGYTLVAADYSQLELRILAALADESALKEVFAQDQDPFKQIAARIKKKPIDEVSAEERNWSKTVSSLFRRSYESRTCDCQFRISNL